MKIISISISKYRSITVAKKIAFSDYTILVGANNEGKSNILRAINLALSAIEQYGRLIYRSPNRPVVLRRPKFSPSREIVETYNWERDFPLPLQEKPGGKQSKFVIEFELTPEETDLFKEETGIRLNGLLPVQITLNRNSEVSFEVVKPGKGAANFKKQANRIARFLSMNIAVGYIPAIRTDKYSLQAIQSLVKRDLYALEQNPEFSEAIEKIRALQKPILDDVAETVLNDVKLFVPSVSNVRLDVSESNEVLDAIFGNFDFLIDDGFETKIQLKGDGIQSLVALSLFRHRGSKRRNSYIYAIEEPESHLHPGAAHELRKTLSQMSEDNQVIITTHNPIFVDRNSAASIVLVQGGKAKSSNNISEIRDALGVRVSDNLVNCEFSLLCEGETDAKILSAVLSELSPQFAQLLAESRIAIEPLGSCGNLYHKISVVRQNLNGFHFVLDDEMETRNIVQNAIDDSLFSNSDYTMMSLPGQKESELEDLFKPSVSTQVLINDFGIANIRKFSKPAPKFSKRMGVVFEENGKIWNDKTKSALKSKMAQYVQGSEVPLLTSSGLNFLGALSAQLEYKLSLL